MQQLRKCGFLLWFLQFSAFHLPSYATCRVTHLEGSRSERRNESAEVSQMSAPKRVKNGSAEIEWGCGVIYHGSGLSNTLIGHQTRGKTPYLRISALRYFQPFGALTLALGTSLEDFFWVFYFETR